MDADAQTRRRAARAAEPAQAPAPYRLIGPGDARAAQPNTPATPAAPAESAAAAEPAAPASPAEPAPRPTPGGADATPPVAPATPGGASAIAPAQPANPAPTTGAEAVGGESGQVEAGETADAGPATPERERAQTALSAVLTQLASGAVDYTKMNTETATRVRAQQPSLTPALTQYGAVRSITPLGERGGSQRFRVTFANGEATFVIATDAQGLITALGVES